MSTPSPDRPARDFANMDRTVAKMLDGEPMTSQPAQPREHTDACAKRILQGMPCICQPPAQPSETAAPVAAEELARLRDDLQRVIQPERILLRLLATIDHKEAEIARLRAFVLCPRHRWEDYEVGETPQNENGHTFTIRITACSRCGLRQDKHNARAGVPEGSKQGHA